MTTFVNIYSHPVDVRYHIAGKEYNRPKVDNVDIDTPTYTTFPFTGAFLLPGEVVDLGDAKVVAVIHSAALKTESPFDSGVSYTNTSDVVQIVSYKVNGKLYDQPTTIGEFNSPTATSAAFDSIRVFPGDTVTLGDSVIITPGVGNNSK